VPRTESLRKKNNRFACLNTLLPVVLGKDVCYALLALLIAFLHGHGTQTKPTLFKRDGLSPAHLPYSVIPLLIFLCHHPRQRRRSLESASLDWLGRFRAAAVSAGIALPKT